MRFVATREQPASSIEPGAVIEYEDRTLIVDEVSRSLEGVKLSCYPPGRVTGKRIVVKPSHEDDLISEHATGQAARVLLHSLYDALTSDLADGPTLKAGFEDEATLRIQWADTGWTFDIETA